MTNCKVTYTFKCFECGKTESVEYVWWTGQILQIPELPEKWASVGDQQFCGDHEIFVNVDQKKNYPLNMNAKNGPRLVKT